MEGRPYGRHRTPWVYERGCEGTIGHVHRMVVLLGRQWRWRVRKHSNICVWSRVANLICTIFDAQLARALCAITASIVLFR